ncbi:metal-sensing transcriptional repressor [Companilactobacillus jidongensis]|uniref:metal-sensing transcriptional repressor n=1 Tax=Companilactobacillus jidongensis TaxID=2486006 RepID=UPI000F78F614|nr:metal-sensing transcriptional repressor [Companilactobacillus jidongensis]
MSQTEEEQLASKRITSQIKRSRGQLDGILHMMEEGRPCDDVLVQLSAVKSGVDKAMKLVIAQNIRKNVNCVDEQQLKDLQDSLDLMLKTK